MALMSCQFSDSGRDLTGFLQGFQTMFPSQSRAILNFAFATTILIAATCLTVADEFSTPTLEDVEDDAILVQISETRTVELFSLNMDESSGTVPPAGLLVWKPDDGNERCAVLKAGGAWPDGSESGAESPLAANVRSGDLRGVGGLPDAGTMLATIQLEPLEGSTLIRGSGFVTPLDGSQVF